MLRGIGLANYIEGAGGFPRERAEVTIAPEGRVELVLGTMNSGQGHETSFAQLLTEWLGVPFDSVDFVAHDTDRVAAGGGSHSGRSMRIASLAIGEAERRDHRQGQAASPRICSKRARPTSNSPAASFTIKGTDRSLGIFDVAKAAATRNDLPEELRGKLDGIGDHTVSVGGFPSGTHVCEVEIDPDTGAVRILRWIGVDDVGRAINPLILHGQTHGAAAQGIGQALLEICHYDRATAQLLSGSFMDYAVPRADVLPSFDCELIEVPATSHRYGIRPGGEGGTTPALGAVINAVVDALVGTRRAPCRDAGDAGAGVARHPRGAGGSAGRYSGRSRSKVTLIGPDAVWMVTGMPLAKLALSVVSIASFQASGRAFSPVTSGTCAGTTTSR